MTRPIRFIFLGDAVFEQLVAVDHINEARGKSSIDARSVRRYAAGTDTRNSVNVHSESRHSRQLTLVLGLAGSGS